MTKVTIAEITDYYEKARFDLTWRINLILSVLLPLLFSSLFFFDEKSAFPAFIGWVLSLCILLLLKRTKKHKLASIIFSVCGVTLCIFTLLAVPESYHFVDSLWMMVIILYTYFVLGKIWGNLALIANMLAIVIFILKYLNLSLELIPELSEGELISHTLNVIICGLIIAYLIYQFLKTTSFAEAKYIEMTTELQNKNEEKTVMLREIHHRVKNNLQVITSLLRLQSRESDDPKTLELFKDSTNRVVAMALIHDKMYQTKDLAKINLEEYLSTLLKDLIHSYSVEIPIIADIKSEVESISNKSLVPLALLFNELVSNSLKHAFNELAEGRIKILIDRENGKIILSYWDNGVWREKQKDTSFGLELIETLTEQMDGSYKRSTKQGTSYEFILPDNL